ncbi:energy-coupled thiamine transporter ThiT [Halalkalibacter okhensis]|uniref:Proton-coupled thiamine transporter YuaJ n=1 Tax=Halalkalibacter okhensis TaxID=333138 RepID=A0A0B0IJA8_9BACI|nr:energy-coupled thiamine transporter ThiT [Halalkalibacter okhensis]KHF41350.1 proton-coupled thiamine transporter YuaJ [Halalkalibacter okhensis]
MSRDRLLTMIEVAVMTGLAIVLSNVKFGALWAMGGSISLIMVPIFIIAFRRGWKMGVITGLLVGLLNLIIGGYVVHPVQLVLDYPLAYLVLGLASVFMLKKGSVPSPLAIVFGLLFATTLRFFSHFASGVIWFGEYAPDGISVGLYSFYYNISYLIPEMLLTLAVLLLLSKKYPQFFLAKHQKKISDAA